MLTRLLSLSHDTIRYLYPCYRLRQMMGKDDKLVKALVHMVDAGKVQPNPSHARTHHDRIICLSLSLILFLPLHR